MIVDTPEGQRIPGSAGQTIGPFFAFGLPFEYGNEIAYPYSPDAIVLKGRVFQGDGNPIPDALVEIWGANPDGTIPTARSSRPRSRIDFTGWGRCATNDEGDYYFWTKNPGPVAGKPAYFAVVVFARGLPDKLHTRIYLPDDEAALAADPFLASLTPEERATLIAVRTDDGGLQHDLHLQGEKETVFLAY